MSEKKFYLIRALKTERWEQAWLSVWV